MTTVLSGRRALAEIDEMIGHFRARLNAAIADWEQHERREAELRDQQLLAYRALAEIRLHVLSADEVEAVDRLHEEAEALLTAHDQAIAAARNEAEQAQALIAELEAERTRLNDGLSARLADYDRLVADVGQALALDKTYQALAAGLDEARSIAARAKEKLSVARDERAEKGEPFEHDPLFMYLWRRGFGTTAYEGGGLFKMLDGWVARLCGYDEARANFKRLSDIPVWLEAHLSEREAKAGTALDAVETAERAALAAAGVQAHEAGIAEQRAALAAVDGRLTQAEQAHQAGIARSEDLLAGRDGPMIEARRKLETGLRDFAFQDLRALAAETVTREDDELVDRLVALRTEQLDLDVSRAAQRAKPAQLKADLGGFESLRRGFKAARLDSDYAQIKARAFSEALADLARGGVGPETVLNRIKRATRQREAEPGVDFGGPARRQSMGLPDIMDTVGREILREIGREMSRGGGLGRYGGEQQTRFPTSRPSRPRRSPAPRKKGGGFKTGGGF